MTLPLRHPFTAPGRSRHECRERMAQRQSHISTLVGVFTAERRRRKPRKEAIKAPSELTNSVSTTYTISRCCCCRSSTRQLTWYVSFDILVRLSSSVNVLFIALPSPALPLPGKGGKEGGPPWVRALGRRTRFARCRAK